MSVILQIIGGIVVAFILLIFVGFLVLRWKLKKLMRGLGDLADGPNLAGGPPMRMRLVATGPNAWEADELQSEVQAFDALGYQRISAYQSPDMPGLQFLPYADANENSYAVVYHQPGGMGVWCDLWTKYEDGSTLTVTSAPRGGELEHRPGNEKIYLPGSPIQQLSEVFSAKINPSKQCIRATIEGFASAFESGYAEEMTWRATKGYSDDEVRAVAALDGGEFSDEILQQTKESLNNQAAHQLNEVLRRKYLEEGGVSAAEWEDQRDRIVIVHGRLPIEDVIEEVSYWLDLGDELENLDENKDLAPREFMDWINESQAPDAKFRKLMTIYDPVEADIWLAPMDPED